jgi:hypothetical protein
MIFQDLMPLDRCVLITKIRFAALGIAVTATSSQEATKVFYAGASRFTSNAADNHTAARR